MRAFAEVIRRGLVVACQPVVGDPLRGSAFVARMAVAAARGGAVAIRADGADDIRAIRESVTPGADAVATTLSGYVGPGAPPEEPDLDLVGRLALALSCPVVAEGRHHTPADAARAIEAGAHAVVVGTAITRPHLIARRFADAIGARIG
jgi:N-acylglucosamine-6-phosphate 2-epimerase